MRFFTGKPTREGSDWALQAADAIERAIDGVRDRAIVPLQTVVRALVFGIIIAFVGVAALVLLVAGMVRLSASYLSNIPGVPDSIWTTYAAVGALFVLSGALLWSKRRTPSQ